MAMNDGPGATSTPGNGTSSRLRNRIGVGLLAASFAFLVGAIIVAMQLERKSSADPDNPRQVALGKSVYDRTCAYCHGARLEGQPNWQEKLLSGRMPAPPHDASGHTWHHPDAMLFGMTKYGLIAGKYAPPGYQTDMPAFGEMLSDAEIRAVLAYIKSSWPADIRKAQREMTLKQSRR
jgi:mono/diheme cytochrome c family protein